MKNIINHIVDFLKSLFSSDGGTSSKRVVGFGTFILFSIQIIGNVFCKTIVQSELIWATVTIIIACFGLNAMIDVKNLQTKNKE